MSNKILFIGSFNKPKNGHYGGVYFASTTLRDGLTKEGYQIVEMDTTLKDIAETRVYKRLPNIITRQFKFLFLILFNCKAKYIFVFLSGEVLMSINFSTIIGKVAQKTGDNFSKIGAPD